MGVALDTYDEENGIHPRNKQLPSKRLATAGLNVAYGLKSYPTNGPFPETWNVAALDDGYQIDILYDQAFKWDPVESEGFYTCCLASVADCNSQSNQWTKLPEGSVSYSNKALSMQIPACATALAYMWEITPVLGTKALPIYADDEFELPGAPWIKELDKMLTE